MTGGLLAQLRRRDDGAYAILFALLLTVIIGVVAIVVDIGLLRHDRRFDKLATDSAVIAGATRLGQQVNASPRAACQSTWNYLVQNLAATGTSPCGVFLAPGDAGYSACPASATNASGTLTGSGGTYDVTITWPVFDTDPLMAPDIRPAASTLTQTVVPDDGTPCERLGANVHHTRNLLFAPAIGQSSSDTANHSVARTRIGPGVGGIAAPLVILDPTACNALTAEGGGGVLIAPNGPIPGLIAVNSDGTGGSCNGSTTTIDSNAMSASNSAIWAQDGTTGEPARILSYAVNTGQTDAYNPAQVTCTSSNPPTGALCPQPSALSSQISRLWFIDNQYNCTATTTGCTASDPAAGISQLRSFVETQFNPSTPLAPSGFYIVQGSECTSPQPVYTGNVYVDCTASSGGFKISGGSVDFVKDSLGHGTVVFAGDVTVIAGGCLLFNSDPTAVGTACTSPTLTPAAQDGPVVFVAGQIAVSGTNSSFIAAQTFVMEGDCSFDGTTCTRTPANLGLQTGGSGNIMWSAPLGPATGCVPATSIAEAPTAACFTNLAVWNEYQTPPSAPDTVSGQAALLLQGTFFTPNAQFVLSGGSGTNIRSAQFVTGLLDVHGGAVLTMVPDAAHTNPPPILTASLIR